MAALLFISTGDSLVYVFYDLIYDARTAACIMDSVYDLVIAVGSDSVTWLVMVIAVRLPHVTL